MRIFVDKTFFTWLVFFFFTVHRTGDMVLLLACQGHCVDRVLLDEVKNGDVCPSKRRTMGLCASIVFSNKRAGEKFILLQIFSVKSEEVCERLGDGNIMLVQE